MEDKPLILYNIYCNIKQYNIPCLYEKDKRLALSRESFLFQVSFGDQGDEHTPMACPEEDLRNDTILQSGNTDLKVVDRLEAVDARHLTILES